MKKTNSIVGIILGATVLLSSCFGNTGFKAAPNSQPSGSTDDSYHGSRNFVEAAGWIYFADPANGNALTQKRLDDSAAAVLSEGPVSRISLSEDWIYFIQGWENGALYRMRPDGSEKGQISPGLISGYVATGHQIIFSDADVMEEVPQHPVPQNHLYQMNGDGTNVKLFYPQPSTSLNVDGEEIFFVKGRMEQNHTNEIHRIRVDGSMDTLLPAVGYPLACQTYGGWLYYISLNGEKEILYRMKYDGSENMMLSDSQISSWDIHDNTLYYSTVGKYYLYSCSLDGSNVKQLTDMGSLGVQAAGGWLYFQEMSDSNDVGDPYRVRGDGTGLEKLQPAAAPGNGTPTPSTNPSSETKPGKTFNSNYINAGPIAEKDGWIYFHDPANQGALSTKTINDPKITILSKRAAYNLSVVGDWVYFLSGAEDSNDAWIYRVKTDGTQEQRVGEANVFAFLFISMVATDEGVFFSNKEDQNSLYGMKLDGSDPKKMTSQPSTSLAADGEWIFFYASSEESDTGGAIKKIRTDGTEETEFAQAGISDLFIPYDGWLYYTVTEISDTPKEDDTPNFFRMKYDGSGKMEMTDFSIGTLCIYEDDLYFIRRTDGYVYSCNLDGSGLKKLVKAQGDILQIAGGWIYMSYLGFYEPNDESYRVRLDGTELERLN